MPSSGEVSSIAHVIQLAVAPVFLLSGMAGLLAVLTNRLGRIIDRARRLEEKLAPSAPSAAPPEAAAIHADLATLSRRARLINAAVTLCTSSALLICAVIAVLFLSAFLRFDLTATVAFLFVAAMLALFGGLLFFLREVFVATASLRIGPR